VKESMAFDAEVAEGNGEAAEARLSGSSMSSAVSSGFSAFSALRKR
jgi:hypothetical protein